jgi:hypothetical protein
MRSKKPELEDVVRQFEIWRGKRHGRLIPDELWKAALSLVDRYAPSTICRHLRLDAGRFKKIRESRSGANGRRTVGRGRSGSPRKRRNVTSKPVMSLAPRSNGFVELPGLGVDIGSGMSAAMLREFEGGPAGCRLSLESGGGQLTFSTVGQERRLVEAVCRLVLGALSDGCRK